MTRLAVLTTTVLLAVPLAAQSPAAKTYAQKLVDDYLAHPATGDWWKNVVRKAALASAGRK